MTARLVTDALVMAIWRRGKPDALLHHSDRGSQGKFKWSSQRLMRSYDDQIEAASLRSFGRLHYLRQVGHQWQGVMAEKVLGSDCIRFVQ